MKLQGFFKLLGPILLTLLAVALADNRMDVKAEQLVTHEKLGQHIGYRQSKWLEKFKRPQLPKSFYGKPEAHSRQLRPNYEAPTATHYTPQHTSYYENPTPYKPAYPAQLNYFPAPAAGRPPNINYYRKPSSYNPSQVVYRSPSSSSLHPSVSKPEDETPASVNQAMVDSEPAQPSPTDLPSQPVKQQSQSHARPVNVHSLHPSFSQPGHIDEAVHSQPEDHRNPDNSQSSQQPTPHDVPSKPVNPPTAAHLPPVTDHQQRPHSNQEPVHITTLQEMIDNHPPKFSFSHMEQLNFPLLQQYEASLSEETPQPSLDNSSFDPVNPSTNESSVGNNPEHFPLNHAGSASDSPLADDEKLSQNNPLQSSYSQQEPVDDNTPEQSYDHEKPMKNSPSGHAGPMNNSPSEPSHSQQESASNNNLPQLLHGLRETTNSNPVHPSYGHPDAIVNRPSVHSHPSQSFYSQQRPIDNTQSSDYEAPVINHPSNPMFDSFPSELAYSNVEPANNQPFLDQESLQPADMEVSQSTPKTQSHSVQAQDSFLSTEVTSLDSSTSSSVVSTENQTQLDFLGNPFSTNIEEDTPSLFFDEFEKSERGNPDPDAGFFEFGMFPKSNNFFLQNYRG